MASLVHAGCAEPGPAAGTSPPGATSPTTSSPSPTRASRAADGLDLCAQDRTPCRLQAGEYEPRLFRPHVSFTLGRGWENDRYYADAFSLGRALPRGQRGGLSIGNVVEVFEEDERRTLPPGPGEFLRYLGSLDGIRAERPVPVEIGGVEGIEVDVEVTGQKPLRLFAVWEDVFNLEPGSRNRLIILDIEETSVVIVIEAPAEQFEAFVAEVAPVLDSFEFE